MFGTPIDAWYVWVGVAAVTIALCGAVLSLPLRPAPDAAGAADTVDAVAAGERPATAEHPLDAAAIRLGPHRLAMRSPAGTARAEFAFGPVTPVSDDRLRRVLHGAHPAEVYDSREAFRQAVVDARATEPTWEPVERTLVVRRVYWGEFGVTLVDA